MREESISQENVAFGVLLRAHRGAVGLTQEELATRAGLSTHAVSMLERGDRRAPRAATVECLAGALRLDPAQRSTFAAAAREWTRPAVVGAEIENGPVPARTEGSHTQRSFASFGRSLPVVFAALALLAIAVIGVLTAGLVPGLRQASDAHVGSAPALKPSVTGLSVSPASLRVVPDSYTTISFRLNVASNVTLTVVDAGGKPVKTILQDVHKKAGPVSRQYYGWNGVAPLPPGRYAVVVTAEANGASATVEAPFTLY